MKQQLTKIVAVGLITVLYGFTRLPRLPGDERVELAARFRFERSALPDPPGSPHRTVRPVHPRVSHIAGWISSVGAGVTLFDLDMDGLPNDLCHVDPRTDRVIVSPVRGTGNRFSTFVLDPRGAGYDARTMAPMGCRGGDFNEDGLSDLLVYYWGRTPVAFLRRAPQEGDRPTISGASFGPVTLLPRDEIWNTNALTQADVDGDGHLDLVVGNYFPDGQRVLDEKATDDFWMHNSMSRAYNGGGNRVLRWVGATAGAEPSVRFEDVGGVFEPDVAGGWTLAAGAADLDGDLLPEVYFANDFGPDRLLHNRSRPGHIRLVRIEGVRKLDTPGSKVIGRDSFKSMGVDFGDLNGDGVLDIWVSNIASEYALMESHFAFVSTGSPRGPMEAGVAPYTERSESLGLSRSGFCWDARLADFDNDGVPEALQATGFLRGRVNRWPELQELATMNDMAIRHPSLWPRFRAPEDDLSGSQHDPFFVRSRSGRYYDLAGDVHVDGHPASTGRPTLSQEVHVSRGIAIADVDGDGRLDFAVANQWDESHLYRNVSPRENAFLALVPLLPAAIPPRDVTAGEGAALPGVRPAIGASATLTLPGGRRLVAFVDGGNGHSGARAPELHFGLDRAAPGTPLEVDMAWRDGRGVVHRERRVFTPGRHRVLLEAQ
jgi:hypothetical protein